MRTAVVLLTVSLGSAGCFNYVEDYCRGCTIVRHDAPTPPRIAEDKRALVVLLHGAFGFGSEWAPVKRALDARPELAYYAFAWPGPFGGDVPRRAEAFRVALQHSVSNLPPSVHEVLLLAHSAGGAVADYAARRLSVPDGVKVHVALLDAARISVAPYQSSKQVDTPLGFAIGTTQEPTPAIPAGVDIGDYRANDPPRPRARDLSGLRPKEIGVVTATGETVVYLGRKVTHGGSVALVSLPLIDRLAR